MAQNFFLNLTAILFKVNKMYQHQMPQKLKMNSELPHEPLKSHFMNFPIKRFIVYW